jgi:mannosyltransferase
MGVREKIVLILILIVALSLRLINLNQSLWLDEAVQVITSRGPVSGILPELKGDFHPPLYHFLLHFWIKAFGDSEISVRMPSVLFGVGTVGVIYLIGKEIVKNFQFARFAGFPWNAIFNFQFLPLLAALLIATAPYHIYYSQEARMYSQVSFFATLSMYFFLAIYYSPFILHFLWWLGYIISTTCALYSDYFVCFLLLAQIIFVLTSRKTKSLKDWFLAWETVTLLLAPWIPFLIKQVRHGQEMVAVLPGWQGLVNLPLIKFLPLTFVKFTIGRISFSNKLFYAILVGTLATIFGTVFFWGLKRGRRETNKFLLLWLSTPILGLAAVSVFVPSFQPFRVLEALPAYYLLLGWGIATFLEVKLLRFLLPILFLSLNLAFLGIYFADPNFHREDWRAAVSYIEKERLKESVVVFPSQVSDWPYRYYARGQTPVGAIVGLSASPDFIEERMKMITKDKKEIWLIRYLVELFNPEDTAESFLEGSGYNRVEEKSFFGGILVWRYKKEG